MEILIREAPEDSGDDTFLIHIQMFEKIDVLSQSTHFKEMWRQFTKQVKDTDFKNELIPLDQVHGRIFKPTFEAFRKSYEELRDLSISLSDLEAKLGKFIEKSPKELQTMAAVFSEDAKSTWIKDTLEHITRYRELQSMEENAKVIKDLRDHLHLCGDFGAIDNFGVCLNFNFS